MNFAGVKTITTPSGVVTKILRGADVLWGKGPDLACNPFVQIYYSAKNQVNQTSNDTTHVFSVTIGGIAQELVQSFGATMFFYNATMVREYSASVSAELLSTDNTIAAVSKTVTINSGSYHYYPNFAGFITYTDLNGETKTLRTSRVSSVGAKAEASA
jgi:hypothetical protein